MWHSSTRRFSLHNFGVVENNYIISSTATCSQVDLLQNQVSGRAGFHITLYLKGSLLEERADLLCTALDSKTIGEHHNEAEVSSV